MTEEQDTAEASARREDSSGPVSREALYEMVWFEPMLKVAARFGVSSSYMARVRTLLNVPRPERGYWAKLAVGKATQQPPLPEPRPGDPLEWTRDGTLLKPARSLPRPPDRKPRRKSAARPLLPDRHPLMSGAKPLFEAGRLSWHGKYLKPAKRLLVEEGERQAELERQRWEARQAAYIAGLIDGEGTITLTRKHRNENRQLVVTISNTERNLLHSVLTIIGAGKITGKPITSPPRPALYLRHL